MTIEATLKENDYSKHTLLITSKAGTWELLINYFEKHYRNECTAAVMWRFCSDSGFYWVESYSVVCQE